ncbi:MULTISPECIES: chemotaxis protein [Helicobacter]|nr:MULTISPECIES: chemotaxis protein [unclassified Helicobacter]MDY4427288.1 chemotaxis protein [Helicobacter sp.]MDY5616790.1 chemotaxis protein [Helicobacter sp.]RAX53407.1 fused signal transduction protein/response regulator [Helicobacter sp. 11-8110]
MSNLEKTDTLKIGTNEMELVDFRIYKIEKGKLYEGVYGINVAKVNEIIRLPELTELPGVPEYIEGIFDLRGVVIPVINLAKWMNVETPKNKKIKPRVIIAEFNNIMIGFIVHEAKRIRRISWKDIEPAHFSSSASENLDKSRVTGVTRIEGDQVLLILDLESIVQDLGFYHPEIGSDHTYNKFDGLALILDDSSIARKIIKDFLEKMGFNVVEANDGAAGLQKLEKLYENYSENLAKQLKIIISDIEMPQMDGFHFAAKVKEDPRFSKIPIIFSSSISDQFSESRGKEAGAESYLVKFDANKFHEEVSRIVSKYNQELNNA